jgi:predicted dehydrogenase
MTAELRIGVIGVGGRGALADHAHKPKEGVRLVAGADIREEALDAFQERVGRDTFRTTRWRELVARDDVDAVFVTTPDYLHEEMAVGALEAGKAVYLEKPMAITVEGCDRILRTARKFGGKLYVGHNMRHMAFVRKMKALIDEGAVGEIKAAWCRHFVAYGGDAYFKDWHSERANVTGLLLQKGAHDIDVLHWLCGGYAVNVNAMGALTVYDKVQARRAHGERVATEFVLDHWPPLSQRDLSPVIDVEDLSMMQMELDNGVFATYQQCHYSPDAWRNYTFIGTEGRIENFGDDPPNCVIRLWNRRTGYKGCGDAEFQVNEEEGTHGGADPKIVDEFIRFVRDGGTTTTSPVAARYSVATGCAATQSLRNGGEAVSIARAEAKDVAYFEQVLVTA